MNTWRPLGHREYEPGGLPDHEPDWAEGQADFEREYRAMQSDAEDLLIEAHALLHSLAGTEHSLSERIALAKAIDGFGRKHITGERKEVSAVGAQGATLAGAPR